VERVYDQREKLIDSKEEGQEAELKAHVVLDSSQEGRG